MTLSRRNFLALSGAAAGAGAMQSPSLAWALGADTLSTAASGLTWPANRALPIFPAAQRVQFADISALNGDEQGLLVSLQGVVNRRQPRLYLYWGTDPTNLEWLKDLGVNFTNTTSPWNFLDQYRSEITGAIVYDPDVPDTINLATTLAGLKNAVIATGDLAKAHGLTVVQDLRGQFADKFAVYNYALQNVWPQTTKRLMAAISPSSTVSVPNVQWTSLLKVTAPVTDASNRNTYTADLTSFLSGTNAVFVRFSDAYTNDGWGPSVSQVTVMADGIQLASFQPGTSAESPFLFDAGGSQLAGEWRFADATEYFIYKFVPPAGTKKLTLSATMWNEYFVAATATAPSVQVVNPLFRDYIVATSAPNFWLDPNVPAESSMLAKILATFAPNSAYLGWFPNGDEMTGVTQCAQQGVYVVAADVFYNGSTFSGTRATIKKTQPMVSAPALANKIYLSLTLVEGDNIQYNQHRMRMMWDDRARGKVPVGWSISVLLRDIAPAMLGYFQWSQTENDLLVAGPSGAGYTYPVNWPTSALQSFMKQSGQYMQATGMNVLFTYNRQNSTDLALSPGLVAQYKQNIPNLKGIVYNYESTSQISMVSGVPVATLLGVNDANSGQTQLQTIAAGWDGKAPLFVAAGLESWNIMPSDVLSMVNALGPQFEVVRPDVFFDLYRLWQTQSQVKTS